MERRERKDRKRNKWKGRGREERWEGEAIEEREGEREGKGEGEGRNITFISPKTTSLSRPKEQDCLDKLVQRYFRAGGVFGGSDS